MRQSTRRPGCLPHTVVGNHPELICLSWYANQGSGCCPAPCRLACGHTKDMCSVSFESPSHLADHLLLLILQAHLLRLPQPASREASCTARVATLECQGLETSHLCCKSILPLSLWTVMAQSLCHDGGVVATAESTARLHVRFGLPVWAAQVEVGGVFHAVVITLFVSLYILTYRMYMFFSWHHDLSQYVMSSRVAMHGLLCMLFNLLAVHWHTCGWDMPPYNGRQDHAGSCSH